MCLIIVLFSWFFFDSSLIRGICFITLIERYNHIVDLINIHSFVFSVSSFQSSQGLCCCVFLLSQTEVTKNYANTENIFPSLSPPVFLLTLFLSCFSLTNSDVEQMAIDWLTGNFYFVDDVDDRIFVCSKDGLTCVILLDLELYNPKGIALDPAMG